MFGLPKWAFRLVLLFVLFLSFFIWSPFFIVQPGERAFIVRLGAIKGDTYNEGLWWKLPLIDTVKFMNIQTSKIEGTAYAASKDLQNVEMSFAVNYSIDTAKIIKLYQEIGTRSTIEEKVISPAVQEGIKGVTARYTAEELITKRAQVSNEILLNIQTKLQGLGCIISAFNIVNFSFSEDFNNSIEAKVKAEQDALTEKNKLEKTKYEVQSQIERAKAQAESIRIQAEAVRSQGGADYVKLKWIEKRNGILPTTSLSNGNSFIIDLQK